MGLETVDYIGDLVITNPTATDPKSQGDDHFRNMKEAVKECFAGFAGAICVCGTDGGAVNAYTITPTTALLAYGTNMVAIFTPTITNTGAATLNISGIAAKDLKSVSGAALTSGDLVAGNVYVAIYNATNFRLIAPTKNYIDQLSFSTTLPAQSGNSGKFLTTDGTNASWSELFKTGTIRFADSTDPTKKLAFNVSSITAGQTRTITFPDSDLTLGASIYSYISTLTPTAAANVEALNVFTSTYNSYVLVVEGVKPGTDDSILFRLATAGAVDTGSNYRTNAASGSGALGSSMNLPSSQVQAAGKGWTAIIHILNANDATNIKAVNVMGGHQDTANYTVHAAGGVYAAANTVSGFRFYLNGGGNFAAQGSIKIYGIKNS